MTTMMTPANLRVHTSPGVELVQQHRPALVQMTRVTALEGGYPAGVGAGHDELDEWLVHGDVVACAVATFDDAPNLPAGHAQLLEVLPYLTHRIAAHGGRPEEHLEVAKLVTAPWARDCGVGAAVLAAILDEADARGRRPVLSVVSTWIPARRLYEKLGLVEFFGFDGKDGRNIVMGLP